MRSWPGPLLLVVSLLLLGARAQADDSLRLSTLVAVYPDTFSDTASADEIENVWREVAEAAAFVQRSSGMRLELDVDPVVVDRFVPREDFAYQTRTGHCASMVGTSPPGPKPTPQALSLKRESPGQTNEPLMIFSGVTSTS